MTDTEPTTFEDRDLSGARFRRVDLSGATFRDTDLSRVQMRGVELVDVDIDGELIRVTLNGVDVAPLVEAELDRRDPERPKMRPDDAEGFREAWQILERRWDETVERARSLDEAQLRESVAEEWSFVQTLRHLAFASDAWVARAILGDPRPWHPLDLPWDTMTPHPDIPWDRDADVSLAQALELRQSRQAMVRDYLSTLTDDQLASHTEPVEGPGWPPAESFPVRECLLIVLNEEYHHRRFAERDLAVLTARE